METKSESNLLHKTSCPSCGSSDANAVYDDGHTYCFSCNAHTLGAGTAEQPASTQPRRLPGLIRVDEFPGWKSRAITAETCRKWGAGTGTLGDGTTVRVFRYYDARGTEVAQKVRPADKAGMRFLGEPKNAGLYGQNLWGTKGKMVVVTEGEIDALSVSQAQGNKWPVVSVPNGAAGARKALQKNLEWLSAFETVVLFFDDDDPGREAAEACASLFKPGSCKLARVPGYKDANEALVAGKSGEIITAIWQAKPWRPDGIVAGSDLWEELTRTETVHSVSYPWAELQRMTKGLRTSEVVTLTAGSGVGKSAAVREIAHHLITEGETIGMMMFEETVKRTALGLIGIELNRSHHEQDITKEPDFKRAYNRILADGHCYLYDHFGSTGFDNVLDRARYMANALGCRYLILDHLSILVSGMADGDERRLIDNAMTSIKTLAMETDMGIILVSHLRRPTNGMAHEEGAHTSLSQLRGSHAIAQLSDMVVGLERDQQDTALRDVTTLRVLKNRYTGVTGEAGKLRYDHFTGRLQEQTDEIRTPGNRDGQDTHAEIF